MSKKYTLDPVLTKLRMDKRKQEYAELAAKGICVNCGERESISGKKKCIPCTDAYARYSRTYKDKKVIPGVCRMCSINPLDNSDFSCATCREVKKVKNKVSYSNPNRSAKRAAKIASYTQEERISLREGYRIKRQKMKQRVFSGYGSYCACCGESGLAFLSLDHVNGDGAKHRRSVAGNEGYLRSGNAFYQWVINNNFPDFLQVLCHNCNMAKGTDECCPHQLPKSHPNHIPMRELKGKE